MRVLGIDFGDKRTGVAISDETGIIACPLKAIIVGSAIQLIDDIKEICEKEGVNKVVVGNPLNMNGSVGKRSRKSLSFACELEKAIGVEVELVDERLTTVQAHKMLNEVGAKGSQKRKNVIDILSAVIILQTYLNKEEFKNGRK